MNPITFNNPAMYKTTTHANIYLTQTQEHTQQGGAMTGRLEIQNTDISWIFGESPHSIEDLMRTSG
jgi:hypothetical protein